ncbi:hypothetical protein [Endozoicomonas lisbonensis]|uniref:hypothetical protein n=1 Tax=Endozoicomonas lisbonensis TaxID=3120522 RepID=UPI0033930383
MLLSKVIKSRRKTRNYTRYQPILDDFEKQKEFALSPVADNEQKRYQRLVAQRDKHLDETDWMVMRENERRIMKTNRFLSDKDFFELLTYRDDLRKLPQYYTHSNDWVWPKVPQCVIRARNPERVKPEQAPVV